LKKLKSKKEILEALAKEDPIKPHPIMHIFLNIIL